MIKELQHELALSEEHDTATVLTSQITSSVEFGAKLRARRKALSIELTTATYLHTKKIIEGRLYL